MNKLLFQLIAWIGIPLAFGAYVHLMYSWSLARGKLPFLGTHEVRWWIAFGVALLLGTACVLAAQRVSATRRAVWAAVYVIVMGVVLLGIHLGVACGNGDCI